MNELGRDPRWAKYLGAPRSHNKKDWTGSCWELFFDVVSAGSACPIRVDEF